MWAFSKRFKLYFECLQVYWDGKQYSTLADFLKHFQMWPDDFRDFSIVVPDLVYHNKLSPTIAVGYLISFITMKFFWGPEDWNHLIKFKLHFGSFFYSIFKHYYVMSVEGHRIILNRGKRHFNIFISLTSLQRKTFLLC